MTIVMVCVGQNCLGASGSSRRFGVFGGMIGSDVFKFFDFVVLYHYDAFLTYRRERFLRRLA